jgi:hypothetical protein
MTIGGNNIGWDEPASPVVVADLLGDTTQKGGVNGQGYRGWGKGEGDGENN